MGPNRQSQVFSMLFVILVFASVVHAEGTPFYVGNAEGVAFNGVLRKEHFQFVAGELGSCSSGRSGNGGIQTCAVAGASIVLSDDTGKKQTLPITSVLIFDEIAELKGIRDFYFSGTWTDKGDGLDIFDEFSLRLRQNDATPTRLWGDLSFLRYKVTYGIEARTSGN